MQIEIPDQVVDALRDALGPLLERLIDEKVQQKRPLLLSVSQVADELACSRQSVYGLIRGGYLETIRIGERYRVASAILDRYVDELTKPTYHVQREVVDGHKVRVRRRTPPKPSTTLLSATKPPRQPRPKPKRPSKQEVADSRMTLAELCDIFGESGSELLVMAGVALADDGTFRRGDVLPWMEEDRERYEEWALTHM